MYGKYLEECVDSVVSQTYKVNEIIIVNDGSPDNTSEIANKIIVKYPNESIRLIEKKNGGLSSARNAGIKISTSDYCFCLDADDKILPGSTEEHVMLMVDDMTIAQCALMEFGERHVIMTPTHPTGLERILNGNTIFCNAMFPKKVWEAIGGYDESETMRLGWEDYEFWIRCLAYGCHVETSDTICLRYRVHGNNMTKMTTHPNWDKLKKYIRDKHIDLYEKFNL
jgi:glycosyltransferase involved in cell wall biosynthesis